MSIRLVRILLLVLIALEGALLVFGPQAKDHLPAIQAALAAEKKPTWEDDASMGIRYAAWINLALLLVLLSTAQWWAKPFPNPKSQPSDFKSRGNPRWFWPLVLLAILTCVAVRLPLASKSLWWDESWVVLQVSHGKWRPDTKKPGELKFTEHDWKRCAFYYQKPTNHVPMSLAQKASFTIWQAISGAKTGEFSDLAARIPALLASMAAVVLLALLMKQWGYPGAGAVAAFLLALHPWYIRYGVDARAYALVVPLCIAGMFAITRIFQTRGYNVLPWVAWGAIEFVWLWAYPNAVVDVAVLNLLLAYGVQRYNDMPWQTLVRLAVTNVFAAMAFIQMFLPNFMQATRWAGNETVSQPLTGALFDSTLSQLVLGVEVAWPSTVEAAGLVSSMPGIEITTFSYAMWNLFAIPVEFSSSIPGIGIVSFGSAMWVLVAILVLLPIARRRFAPSRTGGPWWVLGNLLFSTSLFMLIVRTTGSYFYPRFIIAILPCLILVLCLLVAEAVRKSEPIGLPAWLPQVRRWVAIVLALGLAIQVFPFWKAQIALLTSRPYAPLRDVAEFAEGEIYPRHPKPLLVCYGHGHETLPIYLPTVQSAVSKAELEKYIAAARAEQRELLVIQGHTGHNRGDGRSPVAEGFQLLDDRNLFTEIKAFAGIEPEFYYRVYELK